LLIPSPTRDPGGYGPLARSALKTGHARHDGLGVKQVLFDHISHTHQTSLNCE